MSPEPAVPSRRPSRRDVLRNGLLGLGAAGAAGPIGMAATACAPADDTRMRFMYWGSSFEQEAVEAMLAAFERRPGSSTPVSPLFVPREYETKVNTLVASDKLPDVFYLGAGQGYQLAEQDWLVDVRPYFDRYPELGERLPETYFWWDDDKTFGTQSANEVSLLWYNRALFEKAGVETPPAVAGEAWSYDQLVETADQLTFDAEGRRPSQPGFDSNRVRQFGVSAGFSHWYPLVRSNGGDIVDETGTRYALNSEAAVRVFQDLQDLMYEHRVAPSAAQLGNNAPTSTVQLQTRRTAMVIDGQWVLLDMAQSEDLDYGIGVLPAYQEPVTMAQGGASVISARSKHPREALELYLFHTDPRHVDLFASGLWMPLDRKYYTEPDLIDLWVDNDAHPPEYRTAVVDYALHHSVPNFAQRLRNMLNIQDLLTPALQRIETGSDRAKTVLDELGEQVQPLLEGWYPNPLL